MSREMPKNYIQFEPDEAKRVIGRSWTWYVLCSVAVLVAAIGVGGFSWYHIRTREHKANIIAVKRLNLRYDDSKDTNLTDQDLERVYQYIDSKVSGLSPLYVTKGTEKPLCPDSDVIVDVAVSIMRQKNCNLMDVDLTDVVEQVRVQDLRQQTRDQNTATSPVFLCLDKLKLQRTDSSQKVHLLTQDEQLRLTRYITRTAHLNILGTQDPAKPDLYETLVDAAKLRVDFIIAAAAQIFRDEGGFEGLRDYNVSVFMKAVCEEIQKGDLTNDRKRWSTLMDEVYKQMNKAGI